MHPARIHKLLARCVSKRNESAAHQYAGLQLCFWDRTLALLIGHVDRVVQPQTSDLVDLNDDPAGDAQLRCPPPWIAHRLDVTVKPKHAVIP
jgi:hypothetical protein